MKSIIENEKTFTNNDDANKYVIQLKAQGYVSHEIYRLTHFNVKTEQFEEEVFTFKFTT